MTEPGGSAPTALLFSAGVLLFLVEMGYAVILAAASSLSRVALHRLAGDSDGRLHFLEHMRDPSSAHRIAATLARQLSLLGGVWLVMMAAKRAEWPLPWLTGAALSALVGVLLLDIGMARLLAGWDPRAALRRTAFLLPPARIVLYPMVGPMTWVLHRAGRMQATNDEDREEDQEEEVEALIEVGERDGILEAAEGEMVRGIVDLDETRVREIMTPRPDIVALPIETTVDDARRAVLEAGHSRLPVYRDTVDNMIGVLHVRDLLRAWEEGDGSAPISSYLREVMFVPEPLSAADLLAEMQVKTHIAIVVDEYGGVAGLVTLEDLLEEIVGDIRDEHDLEETPVRQQGDGSWLINAATHVDELEDLFGVDFEERDFDTVGGLVVSVLGRVPTEGESIEFQQLRITVLKADRRRIRQVRVLPLDPPGKATAGS